MRACDAAPLTSVDGIPGALEIAEAASAHVEHDRWNVVLDAGAMARFHLARGDADEGERFRSLAVDRAGAYDARNGTDHHTSMLAAFGLIAR